MDLVCAVLNFVDFDSFGSESKQLRCIVDATWGMKISHLQQSQAARQAPTGSNWIQLDSELGMWWTGTFFSMNVHGLMLSLKRSGLKAWKRFGCFSSFAQSKRALWFFTLPGEEWKGTQEEGLVYAKEGFGNTLTRAHLSPCYSCAYFHRYRQCGWNARRSFRGDLSTGLHWIEHMKKLAAAFAPW